MKNLAAILAEAGCSLDSQESIMPPLSGGLLHDVAFDVNDSEMTARRRWGHRTPLSGLSYQVQALPENQRHRQSRNTTDGRIRQETTTF